MIRTSLARENTRFEPELDITVKVAHEILKSCAKKKKLIEGRKKGKERMWCKDSPT